MNLALFSVARVIYWVNSYQNKGNHSQKYLSANIYCISYYLAGRTSSCYLSDIFHNPLIRHGSHHWRHYTGSYSRVLPNKALWTTIVQCYINSLVVVPLWTLDEKMDLHKFVPGKYVAKMQKLSSKLIWGKHPGFFWYAKNLCPRFTPQFCILRHRNREQFCVNPFFCPVELFEKVPARLPVTKGFFHVAAGKIVSLLPSPR